MDASIEKNLTETTDAKVSNKMHTFNFSLECLIVNDIFERGNLKRNIKDYGQQLKQADVFKPTIFDYCFCQCDNSYT